MARPETPVLKNQAELALMHHSGQLLAQVFGYLDDLIQPGISTMQINDAAERFIREQLQARPASLGQYDYPYVLNTSCNQVVCHGMPNAAELLQSGDIINVDITLEQQGFIADSSKMYLVAEVSPEARRLTEVCYQAMWQGIRQVRPGARLGDVGYAIARYANEHGYSVVRDYCGHGIGRQMHEAPEVLHYGVPGRGLVLEEGMTFTIEPMLNAGSAACKVLADGWTVVTRDKKLSAQWEHTVAVTRDGVAVLTLRPEELALRPELAQFADLRGLTA